MSPTPAASVEERQLRTERSTLTVTTIIGGATMIIAMLAVVAAVVAVFVDVDNRAREPNITYINNTPIIVIPAPAPPNTCPPACVQEPERNVPERPRPPRDDTREPRAKRGSADPGRRRERKPSAVPDPAPVPKLDGRTVFGAKIGGDGRLESPLQIPPPDSAATSPGSGGRAAPSGEGSGPAADGATSGVSN